MINGKKNNHKKDYLLYKMCIDYHEAIADDSNKAKYLIPAALRFYKMID